VNFLFRRRNLLASLFAVTLLAAPLFGNGKAKTFKDIYAVGDSLSDTGNLAAILGFDNGMILDPNTGAPLGVVLQDGRLSDGPLVIERHADEVGSAEGAVASARGGNNYAIAGSVANPDLSPFSPFSLPGTELLAQVRNLLATKPDRFDRKDLVIVFIGNNDLFAALAAPPDVVPSALQGSIANVVAALRSLNGEGAENFLVFGVGNIARTPVLAAQVQAGQLPPEALVLARNLAVGFNLDLVGALSSLRSDRDFSANVWYFPTFATGEFIVSPLGARLTGLTSQTPCAPALGFGQDCATSTFWDMVHVTTAVHAIFADVAKGVLRLPPLVRR
jgi:phospholipase/lecithinase/hemolysin